MRTDRIFWAVAVAVVLIALGSFTLSFMALKDLAAANGAPVHLAFIWPLIVDVSVIVFTAAILVSQLQRRGAKLAIGLTIFYAVVSIMGNVMHAPGNPLGWFIAIIPPLSLIFATEMLRAMIAAQWRVDTEPPAVIKPKRVKAAPPEQMALFLNGNGKK